MFITREMSRHVERVGCLFEIYKYSTVQYDTIQVLLLIFVCSVWLVLLWYE